MRDVLIFDAREKQDLGAGFFGALRHGAGKSFSVSVAAMENDGDTNLSVE